MNFSLLNLFLVFLKVGALTIGGGYVMVPIFLEEIVSKRHWLTEDDFFKVLSIAQVFPGPIAVNLAVASGYRMAGLSGSLIAALGATLPSLVIILVIAIFFQQFYTLWWVQGLFFGLRPAVAALMVAAVWQLFTRRHWTVPPLVLVLAITVIVFAFKINPAWVILIYLGGLFAWIFYSSSRKRSYK
jgi:chromate transporter